MRTAAATPWSEPENVASSGRGQDHRCRAAPRPCGRRATWRARSATWRNLPAPPALVVATSPRAPQIVRVFFALHHEHGIGGIGGEQLGQPVEHAPYAIQLPVPAAGVVGRALGETLGLEAHGLVEELATLVVVVVGRDLAAARGHGRRFGEQVAHAEPQRGEDRFHRALRVTGEEHAAVVAGPDREACTVILVGRTTSLPLAATGLPRLEALGEMGRCHAT